jgi:hypothetical protein
LLHRFLLLDFAREPVMTRGIVTPMRGEARMYNRLDERVWT